MAQGMKGPYFGYQGIELISDTATLGEVLPMPTLWRCLQRALSGKCLKKLNPSTGHNRSGHVWRSKVNCVPIV